MITTAISREEMVRIARDYVDAFGRSDWGSMRGMLAPDSGYEELGSHGRIEGALKIIGVLRHWKQAFPDATGRVTRAFGGCGDAALEVTWEGTHSSPLETVHGAIPSPGERHETRAAFFFTFEGERIKESRQYFAATQLRQIGALTD